MNLFVDDERNPSDVFWGDFDYSTLDWVIVKNYEEFIFEINNKDLPENISFDNDLRSEKEGYDCLKWLILWCIDNKKELPNLYFHTQNEVAKDNMETYLKCYLRFYKKNGKKK